MKRYKLKKIPKRKQRTKTLVVDGKYFAYAARFAQGVSYLSYNEVRTGVFYGFFNSILTLAKKLDTNKMVICWDYGDKSVRREQYPEYKYKKQYKEPTKQDLELNEQFKDEYHNLIEECEDAGFGGNYLDGYESDDLMALYCLQNPDEEIFLATKDADMYQCISDHVTVYNNDDKIKKTDKWFMKTYGIDPLDWNMVKAIGGCTSDNVKGIQGVGEETALKYLREEATPNQTKKIKDNWDTVEFCLNLVTLPHPNLQNGFKFDFIPADIDMEKFISFCYKNGFRSFIEDQHDFQHYFSSSN